MTNNVKTLLEAKRSQRDAGRSRRATLDLFSSREQRVRASDAPSLDYSRRYGTCACGRTGRVWLLRGELICGVCYQAVETEIARRANRGTT